jgi:hypothetical protein
VIRLEKSTGDKFPIVQIGTPPIPVLIRGKEKVIAFEQCNDGISSRAVLALFDKIRYGAIGIINVERIAVGLLLRPSAACGRQHHQERKNRELPAEISHTELQRIGVFYLNFASNLVCNEKRTATKQENLEWHLGLGHTFGGSRRMTDENKTRYFRGFFCCGSLFVAKLKF